MGSEKLPTLPCSRKFRFCKRLKDFGTYHETLLYYVTGTAGSRRSQNHLVGIVMGQLT